MLNTIKYTFQINRSPSEKKEITLMVPQDENLITFGYQYLQREMLRESESGTVPLFAVYDVYSLIGAQIMVETCEGCVWNCPGQRDHMECPGGCLHDYNDCEICIEESPMSEDSFKSSPMSEDDSPERLSPDMNWEPSPVDVTYTQN